MIIKNKNQIKNILLSIEKKIDIEIYYLIDYVHFYLKNDEEYNVFYIENGINLILIPYIKSPIKEQDGFYDIETPYGYGGPIISSSDISFIQNSWRLFLKLVKEENIIAGLFRFNPFYKIDNFLNLTSLSVIKERKVVILDLENTLDEIYSNFSKDNKSKIRKAKNSNLIFEQSNKYDDLIRFSKIYIDRMKENLALEMYLFDQKYFDQIFKYKSKFTKLYILKKESEIIGGAIILHNNQNAHYHLSSCKSEYFNLGPNNFLRYNIILDLKKKNLKAINFGGGKTNNTNDTLLTFKQKFSPNSLWFYIGKLVFNKKKYDQIIDDWELQYPQKKEKFSNFILKYKF